MKRPFPCCLAVYIYYFPRFTTCLRDKNQDPRYYISPEICREKKEPGQKGTSEHYSSASSSEELSSLHPSLRSPGRIQTIRALSKATFSTSPSLRVWHDTVMRAVSTSIILPPKVCCPTTPDSSSSESASTSNLSSWVEAACLCQYTRLVRALGYLAIPFKALQIR